MVLTLETLVPGGIDLCSLPCGIKYKLKCLLLRQFPRRQFHNAVPCSALDVACICISYGFVQIVYLRRLEPFVVPEWSRVG